MVGMREAKQEYFDKENTGVWDVPKFVEMSGCCRF